MHANLLTVEAAVEETFRVWSARLKEFGSTGIIPHAISEARPLLLYPTQRFSQTGPLYPQHAAVRVPGPPASPPDNTSGKYYGSLVDQACRKTCN